MFYCLKYRYKGVVYKHIHTPITTLLPRIVLVVGLILRGAGDDHTATVTETPYKIVNNVYRRSVFGP